MLGDIESGCRTKGKLSKPAVCVGEIALWTSLREREREERPRGQIEEHSALLSNVGG